MVGFAVDALVTLQQRCVYSHRRMTASILTLLITAAALLVVEQFVITKDLYLAAGYAAGTGLGTYVGMLIPVTKKP